MANIDKEEAARIAMQYARQEDPLHQRYAHAPLHVIRATDEDKGWRRPAVYLTDHRPVEWTVYLDYTVHDRLQSSTIVMLTGEGDLIYFGSANDEG